MRVSSTDGEHESTLSWSSWYRGIYATATTSFRSRYTIARARRYFEYTETTFTWRHVAVIAVAPIPGLLASFVAPWITMQPPSAGVLKNTDHCLHFLVTIGSTMMGAMMQTSAVSSIDRNQYRLVDIVVAAAIGTAHLLGLNTLLGYYWRFPVPFSYVLLFVPWVGFLMWGNILALRSRLLHSADFRHRLLLYMPSLTVQLSQVAIYPAYSAIFQASGQWGQYALIALFPFLKMTLKRSIYATSHHLTEFAKETSVSGVEICASMYQSNIMQSTPSPSATVLVIGLDNCQSLVELKMFVDHKSLVANADILNRARSILQTDECPCNDSTLNQYASKLWSLSPSMRPFTAVIVPTMKPKWVAWKSLSRGSRLASSDKLTLTQALELFQAADSLLLVEYLEVAIPIVNAIYVCIASQLKSAVYDPKLVDFYMQPAALRAAMGSVLLYALLQGVTLVGMCLAMRVRYQLPALTLLSCWKTTRGHYKGRYSHGCQVSLRSMSSIMESILHSSSTTP